MSKASTPAVEGAPRKAKIKTYPVEHVPRSAIEMASYNPRQMDGYAQELLQSKLRDWGLVEPLVWNKRTGRLVGGHQRLTQMDAIEADANWMVPVSVIDVDEPTEKAINVFLNNPSAQGTWDLPKLELLFTAGGTDPFAAGFETVDLAMLFPPETVNALLEQYRPEVAEEAAAVAEAAQSPAMDTSVAEIEGMKARRQEYLESNREDIRADHTLVLVADTARMVEWMLEVMGLPAYGQFVSLDRFMAAAKQMTPDRWEVVKLGPPTDEGDRTSDGQAPDTPEAS